MKNWVNFEKDEKGRGRLQIRCLGRNTENLQNLSRGHARVGRGYFDTPLSQIESLSIYIADTTEGQLRSKSLKSESLREVIGVGRKRNFVLGERALTKTYMW